jgi:ubiquitin-activating enzyme E1
MQSIDIGLYDRMVRTYGIDAVTKMTTSSVLIYGLAKGLGTEVGKNLALGGIKNIYLFDNNMINTDDLNTGFYYNEINNVRSKVLAPRLQELNPYITVTPVDIYQNNQQVTILINTPIDVVKEVSQYCRQTNTKLIVLWSCGISGTIFVDAINHTILDKTGENIEPVQLASISNTGFVNCAPNTSHNFQSGDTIVFSNMEGLNLESLMKEYTIKVNNKISFQLNDFPADFNGTFINGTASIVLKPKFITHEPFEKQIINMSLNFSLDLELSKKNVENYIKHFSGVQNIMDDYEIMPVVSIMGSFAASEAIKLITNKYMPASQWFTWSDETLNIKSYKEIEPKLKESKWFIVGSGAIGCEHLKNLAFMGVTNITITDPDMIEKSNLNRQFLFRPQHIGKSKSMTASEVISKMRPNMNITPLLEKVGSDNIEFTNGIMTSDYTGVFNALDNIKARKFMDEQCFKFGLPLFESGTMGTKGSTQAVIPFVTETYSASTDMDTDKSFPMCTIKSFPNEIQHTIHWAMDYFEFFNRGPSNMNRWLENPNFLEELSPIEKTIAMEDIHNFSLKYMTHTNIEDCIRWAFDLFVENYYTSICQLLHTFKPDHEITPGVKFWSAGKRCPQPIIFDFTNPMHIDMIEATANLLATCSGIHMTYDRSMIQSLVSTFKVNEIKIVAQDSEKTFELGEPSKIKTKFVPIEFNKDLHTIYITSVSNLRAINYNIPIISQFEAKGIAGRIIPAISTTTSIVSGLILLEMVKYLLGFNKVEQYRSTFINLADPLLVYSDPIVAPMIEINGTKINSWTKFEYKKDTTLGCFKEYYEEMFKTPISMIVVETSMLYAEFLGSDNLDKKLSEIICQILETETVPNNLSITLATDDDIELPTITLQF